MPKNRPVANSLVWNPSDKWRLEHSTVLGLKSNLDGLYIVYMSKPVMLNDEAYAALKAHKKSKDDSLSKVVLRFVPPPMRTLRDLERHLENIDGPLIPDLEAIRRTVKRRKRHAAA